MTYEYLCEACGHRWEADQRISEDPLTDCPHCHEARAQRQISLGGGFILKGGGWYSDLYSSASNKPEKADKADTSPEGDKPSAVEPAKKSESSETTPKKTEASPVATTTASTSSEG